MNSFVVTLLVITSLNARAQEAEKSSAYVPDRTCPFLRDSQDPSTDKLLKAVNESIEALAKRCEGKLVEPLDAFKKAITQLGQDSGVQRFQAPGAEEKGYRNIPVGCDNYPDVLRSEFEAASAAAQAGSQTFPSADYKKCLAGKDAVGCTRSLYLDKMREQKHRCLMDKQSEKWAEQRKRYETLTEQLSTSLNAIVTGSDKCTDGKSQFIDMALQGAGLFAPMWAALGPYGMGAALGVDVLRSIVQRASPSQMAARNADAAKRRAELDRLSCLYLDTMSTTMNCPSRMNDLRGRVLKTTNGADPHALVLPKLSIDLMDRVSRLQALLQRVRASRNDRRMLGAALSDLQRDLEKTPVDVPSSPTGSPPTFTRAPSLRAYLQTSANWLAQFSEAKVPRSEDTFFAREVEFQGRQLQDVLKKFDELANPKLRGAEVDAAEKAFLESLDGSGDKKTPPFNLEETLSHMLERFPASYGFRDVAAMQLLKSSQPAPRPVSGKAQEDLVRAFTALVANMQSSGDELFDASKAKPFLAGGTNLQDGSATQRKSVFDANVEPLFRSCSLLSGLLFYKTGAHRTPLTHLRGGRDEGWTVKWPFSADFRRDCGPLVCDPVNDRGVLPFDKFDPNRPDLFHEAQCWALQSYEARLDSARRNYLATGDVCKAPPEPVPHQSKTLPVGPVIRSPGNFGGPIPAVGPAKPVHVNPPGVPAKSNVPSYPSYIR